MCFHSAAQVARFKAEADKIMKWKPGLVELPGVEHCMRYMFLERAYGLELHGRSRMKGSLSGKLL